MRHTEPIATQVKMIILTISALLLFLLVWAYFAVLDEVAIGEARVTTNASSQMIQAVDGGVLQKLFVKEGDIVKAGDVLVELDAQRYRSQFEKTSAEVDSLRAIVYRCEAEIRFQEEIAFPSQYAISNELKNRETNLLKSRIAQYNNELANVGKLINLKTQELALLEPLLAQGSTTEIEVLRLRQTIQELKGQEQKIKDEFQTRAKLEYAKSYAELDSLQKGIVESENKVSSTVIKSPVTGVVKSIDIPTIGAVVRSGEKIMEIIPSQESLKIEAKITPRDIAFIHPEQEAIVKITAYDSSIYGFLKGRVVFIAPDTMRDEINKEQVFYKVDVVSERDYLLTENDTKLQISPGMIGTVEIKTGQKTVLDYLIKPFNKAKEALRER